MINTRSSRAEGEPFLELPETHAPRRNGGIARMRAAPFAAEGQQQLDRDLALALQLDQQREEGIGEFFTGPTEIDGAGRMPVLGRIPARAARHRINFNRDNGMPPNSNAEDYVRTRVPQFFDPNNRYEFLHANGHGQVGPASDKAQNIFVGSSGANTEMIPFDAAISGNTDVRVGTTADVVPGTKFLHQMNMAYYLGDDPNPFFTRVVRGNRGPVTPEELTELNDQAAWLRDPELIREAAARANPRPKRARESPDDSDTRDVKRARLDVNQPDSASTDAMDLESAQLLGQSPASDSTDAMSISPPDTSTDDSTDAMDLESAQLLGQSPTTDVTDAMSISPPDTPSAMSISPPDTPTGDVFVPDI